MRSSSSPKDIKHPSQNEYHQLENRRQQKPVAIETKQSKRKRSLLQIEEFNKSNLNYTDATSTKCYSKRMIMQKIEVLYHKWLPTSDYGGTETRRQ